MKGLEALKKYRSQQQGVNVHADEYLDTIEQELRCWSICVKKQPDLCNIYWITSYRSYLLLMEDCEDKSFILEEDEFNLLKEMLSK